MVLAASSRDRVVIIGPNQKICEGIAAGLKQAAKKGKQVFLRPKSKTVI
jgi:hypothetical protein